MQTTRKIRGLPEKQKSKKEQNMKNFVEELKWRGMIQDIMPGTEEKLMEGPTAAYVGIDPTADSLQIGRAHV